MPRAEVGSTKHISNQMKQKGLTRLRWYCQTCQKPCRDENGFKCHIMSESHVRNMQVIGEDPRKVINENSQQFQSDFIKLLRTAHGEKKININHFYQEYIRDRHHMHMNATKWNSLTEFAKYLGREGICRVEEEDEDAGAKGCTISWIDNTPEALRRQDALRKKERQDRGDEERELRAIEEQIRRARKDGAVEEGDEVDETEEEPQEIKRVDGEKIKLSFGTKAANSVEKPPSPPLTDKEEDGSADAVDDSNKAPAQKPFTVGLTSSKPMNVFAAAKKKVSGMPKGSVAAAQKPISEAERIMKEEIERKRLKEAGNAGNFKRQRVA